MLRFYYVIIKNLFRMIYMIPIMRYQARHPEKYSLERRYKLVRKVIEIIRNSAHVHTDAYGLENLPKEGGYVMVPNHQGKYDVLGIIHSHDAPCSFVMDKDKSHMILVNEIVELSEGKRMDINDVRQAMTIIIEVAKEVKEGRKYIIFPEGGYDENTKNNVSMFKPGSFKCAVKAKAPIVPVALIDSYKVFNGTGLGRVSTQVHFLKPLYYDDYKDLKTVDIAHLVQERISEIVAQYSTAGVS